MVKILFLMGRGGNQSPEPSTDSKVLSSYSSSSVWGLYLLGRLWFWKVCCLFGTEIPPVFQSIQTMGTREISTRAGLLLLLFGRRGGSIVRIWGKPCFFFLDSFTRGHTYIIWRGGVWLGSCYEACLWNTAMVVLLALGYFVLGFRAQNSPWPGPLLCCPASYLLASSPTWLLSPKGCPSVVHVCTWWFLCLYTTTALLPLTPAWLLELC